MHKDNRVGCIDVHLAERPREKDEVSWTCEFQLLLIARRWFEAIEDIIDPSKTSVGRLFIKGKEVSDWITVHEAAPPLSMMKEGHRKICPLCGQDSNVIYRGLFFADPAVLGRAVIVNGEGIFVRKAEAEQRSLRTPAGAFKPVTVRYRPEWTVGAP